MLAAGRVVAAGSLSEIVCDTTAAEVRTPSWEAAFTTLDGLVALDRASGREAWASARIRLASAPVVTSGRVVAAARDGTLLGFAP